MIRPINKDRTILEKKARPATRMDVQTAQNLCETLLAHENGCAGMAANMIGIPVAIIAFFNGPVLMEMFNPVITKRSGKYLAREGCLSLPGERSAFRYKNITVTWEDRSFVTHTADFTGFAAQTIQHEIDHLNGLLI